MLWFIDHWVEKKFKSSLHQTSTLLVAKAINEYKQNHPDLSSCENFARLLNIEVNRVRTFADRSILRGRVQRAKWVFWMMLIVNTIIAIINHGSPLEMASPAISAFAAWLITVGTIPISYNQRIKGGLLVVINAQEEELRLTQELAPRPAQANTRPPASERPSTARFFLCLDCRRGPISPEEKNLTLRPQSPIEIAPPIHEQAAEEKSKNPGAGITCRL